MMDATKLTQDKKEHQDLFLSLTKRFFVERSMYKSALKMFPNKVSVGSQKREINSLREFLQKVYDYYNHGCQIMHEDVVNTVWEFFLNICGSSDDDGFVMMLRLNRECCEKLFKSSSAASLLTCEYVADCLSKCFKFRPSVIDSELRYMKDMIREKLLGEGLSQSADEAIYKYDDFRKKYESLADYKL